MSEETEIYKKDVADLTEQRDTAMREGKALAQQVVDAVAILQSCRDQGMSINGDGMVQNLRAIKAEDLVNRFSDVYGELHLSGSMIEPGQKLWHDYYAWTGEYMILTEQGWEPGSGKESYKEMAEKEGVPLSELIFEELNPPALIPHTGQEESDAK